MATSARLTVGLEFDRHAVAGRVRTSPRYRAPRLKPANLYLKTRDDGSIELKVLDFSISRLLDRAGERKTTIVVGTRGFMASEQAAGYDVDHRADIYSLGPRRLGSISRALAFRLGECARPSAKVAAAVSPS